MCDQGAAQHWCSDAVHLTVTSRGLGLLSLLGDVAALLPTALHPWILKCRAALGAGLVSMDNCVRRASAEALGELARLGGNSFAKNLVASIQKQLQEGTASGTGAESGAAVMREILQMRRRVVWIGRLHDYIFTWPELE